MKLIGNLKRQVEKAGSKDEARDIIEKAGMKLTDDELSFVTGGTDIPDHYDSNNDESKSVLHGGEFNLPTPFK